jgi:hypothetical protein
MSAAAAVAHQECDSLKTITCPEKGKFRRHKNSNICDNFRCALHPKNAGQKMGGGGGRRNVSLASGRRLERLLTSKPRRSPS